MSRLLLAVALILAATAAPAAGAQGRAWDFRVLLDDAEIGWHRFTLRAAAAGRELRSEARFEVRFLAVPVYRYEHEATELWRDGCLRELASRTDENGKRQSVNWRDAEHGCQMSFAYWNPKILKAERLLNAQTGELLPVSVQPLGEESIQVRGRTVRAQRYRLDGPQLAIDIWLDDGEWVALESAAKGGRRLRYELR